MKLDRAEGLDPAPWTAREAGIQVMIRRVCFVVNPFAGVGGPLGMKGSDGLAVEALRRRLKLSAPERARRFVRALTASLSDVSDVLFLTAEGAMGSTYLSEAGLSHVIVYSPSGWPTSSKDTEATVRACLGEGAEVIVFVGGDGTARDVLRAAGSQAVLIGVPAGVKMYSGVFAETSEAAAGALKALLRGEAVPCPVEILDINEEAFRGDRLDVKLYGVATSVCSPGMVTISKQPTHIHDDALAENVDAIARYVVENMEECTLYILGPGTTVEAIARRLGVKKTLLGVDVVHNGRLVAADVDEETLYKIVHLHRKQGGRVVIVVTPIGGQGFILGRGNQQISPRVIREAGGADALLVVAPRAKLEKTPMLRVDTGDPELDKELAGYVRVVIDYGEETVAKVSRYGAEEDKRAGQQL